MARRARKVNTAVFQGEEDRSSAEAKGEESGDRQRRECPPGPGYVPVDPREREPLRAAGMAQVVGEGGGGAREHFRWEGEKGEGKEGVPKRLTVAYAPALPGKPQVFLLQERAARPNWT